MEITVLECPVERGFHNHAERIDRLLDGVTRLQVDNSFIDIIERLGDLARHGIEPSRRRHDHEADHQAIPENQATVECLVTSRRSRWRKSDWTIRG